MPDLHCPRPSPRAKTFTGKTDGKLNAIELKKLEPGFHADGRGLYLDVQESGSRSWILTDNWFEVHAYDSLVIEAALAHQVKGIERHYLRTTFFDQRKKLMESWAS